jgi:hypothetical protein
MAYEMDEIGGLNTGDWQEKFIRAAYGLTSASNNASGDLHSAFGHRIEVKTSFCNEENGKFKFKRIRPFHDLTHYIFQMFDAFSCEFYLIFIPANILYKFMDEFGYHTATDGTRDHNKEQKYVTREFALRPDGKTKDGKLFMALRPWIVTPAQLKETLQTALDVSSLHVIPKRANLDDLIDDSDDSTMGAACD